MDKLFEADLTEIFVSVAMRAAGRFEVSPKKSVHLDATSLHAHGHYAEDEGEEPAAIHLTHGCSRDHRPDLMQFVVDLWVFQLFQAVHLLNVDGTKRIANLTEERKHILSCLVPDCRRYYLCTVE